jgi:predicted CXXCH cytochrome family protein
VEMGCENCHQAASKDNATSMSLRATGATLCAKCHQLSTEGVLHEPYKSGQCLICHDPHTGSYPAHTRAAASALCLGCHSLNRPDVSVNRQSNTVSLLDGRVYDLKSWEAAPKIAANHGKENDAASASAPIAVRKSGTASPKVGCLSCHNPHSSRSQHLLRGSVEPRGAGKPCLGSFHGSIPGSVQRSSVVSDHSQIGGRA